MATRVKKIEIKGKKVFVEMMAVAQPKGYQSVVNKKVKETTDQIPHGDLTRVLEKMTPHLLFACEFAKPVDENDNFLQKSHFDDYWWRDDERFDGLVLTGVEVVGKTAPTGIYLIGKKSTTLNGIVDIKTPLISLERKAEDKNYPLLAIVDAQFESVITEVEEFQKGKTGDQQLSASFPEQKEEKTQPVKKNVLQPV